MAQGGMGSRQEHTSASFAGDTSEDFERARDPSNLLANVKFRWEFVRGRETSRQISIYKTTTLHAPVYAKSFVMPTIFRGMACMHGRMHATFLRLHTWGSSIPEPDTGGLRQNVERTLYPMNDPMAYWTVRGIAHATNTILNVYLTWYSSILTTSYMLP